MTDNQPDKQPETNEAPKKKPQLVINKDNCGVLTAMFLDRIALRLDKIIDILDKK